MVRGSERACAAYGDESPHEVIGSFESGEHVSAESTLASLIAFLRIETRSLNINATVPASREANADELLALWKETRT